MRFLTIILLVLVLGSCSKESMEDINLINKTAFRSGVKNDLLNLINEARSENIGLQSYIANTKLEAFAKDQNIYMIKSNSLDQRDIETRKDEIATELGVSTQSRKISDVREIVFRGAENAQIAINQLRNNPFQWRAIVGKSTDIGIDVMAAQNEELFYTLIFIRR